MKITHLFSFSLFLASFSLCSQAHSSAKCTENKNAEEMTQEITCVYKGQTLEQAYIQAIRDDKLAKGSDNQVLKPTLPLGNSAYNYRSDRLNVSVAYLWKNKKTVKITLGYDGGETTWRLVERPNATIIIYHYSAD